jgi:acetate kinase
VKPVLVVNSGSSSLKYQVIDIETETSLLAGLIERVEDHSVAFNQMVSELDQSGITLEAIGHRVVHGGAKFSEPTLITPEVIAAIEDLVPLAPLHNPGNLAGIRGAIKAFPGLPQVAVFDTAFHQTMPKSSYTYAINAQLSKKYGIRKYGFHGSSHAFVSKAAAKFLRKESFTGIVLHLGNGGSACAIKDGKSTNTSMGMTPLQGLVMGTRAGDIDPAIVLHLSQVAGMSIQEIDQSLNKDSGLMGLTGDSDLRDVEKRARDHDEVAQTALAIYALRIKHYIGAYLAQLGEIDAIVFTAGVGENSVEMREQVCSGLEHFGIELDYQKNSVRSGEPRDIATRESKVRVLVIPTNEELEIALSTVAISGQSL